jgi:hypothetical protein
LNTQRYPGPTPGTVAFLKAALSNFSSVFEEELANAGGLLENITALAGSNYTTNNPGRLTYVQVRPTIVPRHTPAQMTHNSPMEVFLFFRCGVCVCVWCVSLSSKCPTA